MDPLTAIGAVASIVQLAQAALSLSKTLYSIGEAIASASDDIQILADDLKTFSQSLTLLSRLLEDSRSWYSDDIYLLTAKIIKDCVELYMKIDKVLLKLGTNGTSNWKLRVKFVYKEGKIKKLLQRLRDMKGTLATILMSLQVDLQLSLLNISSSSKIQREPEKALQPETIRTLEAAKDAVQASSFYSRNVIQDTNSIQLKRISSRDESTSNETSSLRSSANVLSMNQSFVVMTSPSHQFPTPKAAQSRLTNHLPIKAPKSVAPSQVNTSTTNVTETSSSIVRAEAEVASRSRSVRSVSSTESFKSAVSVQDEDLDMAKKIKAIQSIMHGFQTALQTLENLIEKRINCQDSELYRAATDFQSSLQRSRTEVFNEHVVNFKSFGSSYLQSFTTIHSTELQEKSSEFMTDVVTKLHIYSAEHEDLDASCFHQLHSTSQRYSQEILLYLRALVRKQTNGLYSEKSTPPSSSVWTSPPHRSTSTGQNFATQDLGLGEPHDLTSSYPLPIPPEKLDRALDLYKRYLSTERRSPRLREKAKTALMCYLSPCEFCAKKRVSCHLEHYDIESLPSKVAATKHRRTKQTARSTNTGSQSFSYSPKSEEDITQGLGTTRYSTPESITEKFTRSSKEPSSEEDPYKIKCICGFTDDDGNTIFCETCETWQHIECFYPNQFKDVLNDNLEHFCVDCRPRQIDVLGAVKRQQDIREGMGESLEQDRKRARNSASKSHRKKAKHESEEISSEYPEMRLPFIGYTFKRFSDDPATTSRPKDEVLSNIISESSILDSRDPSRPQEEKTKILSSVSGSDKRYTCDCCGKIFDLESSLRRHRKTHISDSSLIRSPEFNPISPIETISQPKFVLENDIWKNWHPPTYGAFEYGLLTDEGPPSIPSQPPPMQHDLEPPINQTPEVTSQDGIPELHLAILPSLARAGETRLWWQALYRIATGTSQESYSFLILKHEMDSLLGDVVEISDEYISTVISKKLKTFAVAHKNNLGSPGFLDIYSMFDNIISIVTTIDEQMGLEVAALGWTCIWIFLEIFSNLPQTQDPSIVLKSCRNVLDIVGVVARYAVMENLYSQTGGRLLLKPEYRESLVSLCSSILEFFGAAFNIGHILSDRVKTTEENFEHWDSRCDILMTEIKEKDKACKGFRIVVEVKEDVDSDSDSEGVADINWQMNSDVEGVAVPMG